MKTWIKICGNTNLPDCLAALEAGADAVGFIFAESPRRIEPEAAADIISALPAGTPCVGVFVNPLREVLEDIAGKCRLTGVQLHGDETPEFVRALREAGNQLKIVKTLHAQETQFRGLGAFAGGEDYVDAILIDSGTPQERGGTGRQFDWLRLHDFIAGLQQSNKVIIAGGLSSENVGAAVAMFHPFGVDVLTGVEREKGIKDPEKLRAFIAAVRRAELAPAQ